MDSGQASTSNVVLEINSTTQVKARIRYPRRRWTDWSALVQGTYVVGERALVITEIMYHPADPGVGSQFADADEFEFIELMNAGPNPINLAGLKFVNGIDFTFPAMQISPDERVVAVVETGAAILGREQHAEQPHLSKLPHQVAGKLLVLIEVP